MKLKSAIIATESGDVTIHASCYGEAADNVDEGDFQFAFALFRRLQEAEKPDVREDVEEVLQSINGKNLLDHLEEFGEVSELFETGSVEFKAGGKRYVAALKVQEAE